MLQSKSLIIAAVIIMGLTMIVPNQICVAADAKSVARRSPAVREGKGFANPLAVKLADPFIFREGDTYYLYGTSGGSRGTMGWTSKNLIDWRSVGFLFERTNETYSRQHFWAPELFKHRGKYYLHFTASSETTTLRLVLCESDSPTGPFKEVKAPWFESEKAVIDGNVFRDKDGQLYLYYVLDCSENVQSEIYVRRLNHKLEAEDEPTLCIKPSQEWEGSTWNEAPFVLLFEGVYYLMYSANFFGDRDYSVGYATARSPLGPWTKASENPILKATSGVSGPGHNAAMISPNGKEIFIVYHSHQQTNGQGWHRQLAIDRMGFVRSGRGKPARLVVNGPTRALQPMPSGAQHWPVARSDEFDGALDRTQWLVMSEYPRAWTMDDGWLRIVTQDGDIAGDRADIRNLFYQYAPAGDFDVTTRLRIAPNAEYEQAFLTLFQDHNRFIKVGSVYSQGGRKIEFGTDTDGVYDFTLFENTFGEELLLRMKRQGNDFSAYASADGREWMTLKEDLKFDMIDLKIGIAACAPGSEKPIPAAFDFLRIEQTTR